MIGRGAVCNPFIFHEIKTFIDYERPDAELNFWRTHTGLEVDFIFNNQVAIEVKATSMATNSDLKGLRAVREESSSLKRFILVTLEEQERLVEGVEILPLNKFLEMLWSGF